MCSCSKITEPEQVCDDQCLKRKVRVKSNNNGQLVVTDPVTGKVTEIVPDQLDGFAGAVTTTCDEGDECNAHAIGLDSDGNWNFDYGFGDFSTS